MVWEIDKWSENENDDIESVGGVIDILITKI